VQNYDNTGIPTVQMDCHPIQTGVPISAIPTILSQMPFLVQPSQFIVACDFDVKITAN